MVASQVGGRIESVSLYEGQVVEKGDILYLLDMSDSRKELVILENDSQEVEEQINFLKRFVNGIDQEKNPFSDNPESKEYPYYVQFMYFMLNIADSRSKQEFSDSQNSISLQEYEKKILEIKSDIKGLELLRDSIITGKNLLNDYPEYESQFNVYCSGIEALDLEYEYQVKQNDFDGVQRNTDYYTDTYNKQIAGYKDLIEAINIIGIDSKMLSVLNNNGEIKNKKLRKLMKKESLKEGSIYRGLLDTYLIKLEEYESGNDKTVADSEGYVTSALLQYEQTKLEYENKLNEILINNGEKRNKEELLTELKNEYDNAVQRQLYTTTVKINATISNIESELTTEKNSLDLYMKMKSLAEGEDDNSGTKSLSIAAEKLKQSAAMNSAKCDILGQLDEVGKKLEELQNIKKKNEASGQTGLSEEQEQLLQSLGETKKDYERKLELTEMYIEAIETMNNPFSSDSNSDEYSYYIQFKSLEINIENLKSGSDYDLSETEAKIQQLLVSISEQERMLKGANAFLDSVRLKENLVAGYTDYVEQYKLYEEELRSLELEYLKQKKEIENKSDRENEEFYRSYYSKKIDGYSWLIQQIRKYQEGVRNEIPYIVGSDEISQVEDKVGVEFVLLYKNFVEKTEGYDRQINYEGKSIYDFQTLTLIDYMNTLEELTNKLDELQLKENKLLSPDEAKKSLSMDYENSKNQQYFQKMAQIEASISSKEIELRELEASKSALEIEEKKNSKRKNNNGDDIQISITITEKEASLLADIDRLQKQRDSLNEEIEKMNAQIELGTVFAEQTGVVNMIRNITPGDIIPAGTQIATIIPQDESQYKVQIYVSNADIGNISEGDLVRYNIAAFPSSQYGTVNGIVTKVGSDVMLNDGQYSGFFLVEADIENHILSDKDGNSGRLAIGMQTEVKIVTQQKSIIRYLLEKIDLW